MTGDEGRPSPPPGSEDAPREGAAGGIPGQDEHLATTTSSGAGRSAKDGVRSASVPARPSPSSLCSTSRTPSRLPAPPSPPGERGAAGAAPALGNYANNPSAGAADAADAVEDRASIARMRRAERWSLLNRVRPLTSLAAVRKCRRVTITGTGGPTLRVSGTRGAGYAGLATCGSVWACPPCAAKIAARRAEELADVMAAVHRSGGSAYLVTLTMRHHKGQRLATLWDAVSAAWSAVTTGRAWTEDQAGMLGWARVVEVTHSPRSGWHVHVHALLAWSGQVDPDEAQRVAFRAWRRWDAALRRRELDSTPVHGVDARPIRVGSEGLGEYFIKAAREVTAAYAKDSRGGRSPFAILRDAVETYAADDVELLWQWEAASRHRKQLTWSTGRMDLRAFAGLRREQTDAEVAAEETGGTDVIALPGETWSAITRAGQDAELLDVAEIGGADGATAWLDGRGLQWDRPRPRPRRPAEHGPRPRSPQTRREAREVLESLDYCSVTR